MGEAPEARVAFGCRFLVASRGDGGPRCGMNGLVNLKDSQVYDGAPAPQPGAGA